MRTRIVLLQLILIATLSAHAEPLPLHNSGTDTGGVMLALGSIDPRIAIIDRTDGRSGTAAYAVPHYVGWLPNSATSLWLSASPDPRQAGIAQWTFRVPIDLSGYAQNTARIQVRVTSDNAIIWTQLNGHDIGFTTDVSAFIAWHNLSLTNGFRAGLNYLDFRVNDSGPPSGFRIELSGEAVAATTLSVDVAAVRLCWYSLANKTYQLQYRSDLTSNTWIDLGSPIVGTGATNCLTEPVIDPRRFYRVVTLP